MQKFPSGHLVSMCNDFWLDIAYILFLSSTLCSEYLHISNHGLNNKQFCVICTYHAFPIVCAEGEIFHYTDELGLYFRVDLWTSRWGRPRKGY